MQLVTRLLVKEALEKCLWLNMPKWNPNAAREKKLLLLEIGLKKGQGWDQRWGSAGEMRRQNHVRAWNCGFKSKWAGRAGGEAAVVEWYTLTLGDRVELKPQEQSCGSFMHTWDVSLVGGYCSVKCISLYEVQVWGSYTLSLVWRVS